MSRGKGRAQKRLSTLGIALHPALEFGEGGLIAGRSACKAIAVNDQLPPVAGQDNGLEIARRVGQPMPLQSQFLDQLGTEHVQQVGRRGHPKAIREFPGGCQAAGLLAGLEHQHLAAAAREVGRAS